MPEYLPTGRQAAIRIPRIYRSCCLFVAFGLFPFGEFGLCLQIKKPRFARVAFGLFLSILDFSALANALIFYMWV